MHAPHAAEAASAVSQRNQWRKKNMAKRSGAGVGRTLSVTAVLVALGLMTTGGAMAADKGSQPRDDTVAHVYCPTEGAPDVRKCGDSNERGHDLHVNARQHETPTEPEPNDAGARGAKRR